MQENQKEFLTIKSMINQKSNMVLPNLKSVTVLIDETLRHKIKEYWKNSSLDDQLLMFHENTGLKLVSKAMRDFGKLYYAAKKNYANLSTIDKAIMERTYFATEELPHFENKVQMTQLFCNGRDSNGAYRIHDFFYLLPTSQFEMAPENDSKIKIIDFLKGIHVEEYSNPAKYCLNLLKTQYGDIRLDKFKKGIFLGDYNPENIWSAWRYMNCREFTLNETPIIPRSMYDYFMHNAIQYSTKFFNRMETNLLSELWKTNISIAIFSTLFENNILLSFFQQNKTYSSKYRLFENGILTDFSPTTASIEDKPDLAEEKPIGSKLTSGKSGMQSMLRLNYFQGCNLSALTQYFSAGQNGFDIPSLKKCKKNAELLHSRPIEPSLPVQPVQQQELSKESVNNDRIMQLFTLPNTSVNQCLPIPNCFKLDQDLLILYTEPSTSLENRIVSLEAFPKVIRYIRKKNILKKKKLELSHYIKSEEDSMIISVFKKWRNKSSASNTTNIHSGPYICTDSLSFHSLSNNAKVPTVSSEKKPYMNCLEYSAPGTNTDIGIGGTLKNRHSEMDEPTQMEDSRQIFKKLIKNGLVRAVNSNSFNKFLPTQDKIDCEALPPRFQPRK